MAILIVAVALIVVGSWWWTKTITVTATALVQASIEPVEAPDYSTSQYFISNVTSPMTYPCLPNASHGTSVVMPPDTSSP